VHTVLTVRKLVASKVRTQIFRAESKRAYHRPLLPPLYKLVCI